MAHVTLYSTMMCPYCFAAKKLLKTKGTKFEEIDVTMSPKKRATMIQLAGGRTSVPQIFIDETHVGGFDDLSALDRSGKLNKMLEA